MGTTWSASFISVDVSADAASRSIQAALDRVVAEMSPWESGSDLVRYNDAPAGSWVAAPPAFVNVLNAALHVAEETGGAYDPACGALVDLWGFGPAPRQATPPSGAEVAAAKEQSDWRHIRIEGGRIFQPGGARIDLCSIAKGFAVDEAGAALERLGAASWLVEVGGELKGRGTKPTGEPWWAALDAGGSAADRSIVIALVDLAVATSGTALRYFESGERRFSHVLDPRSGFPIANGLAAVSVLHESAMLADAYATALLVLGAEEGPAFAGARQLAARFVLDSGQEILTPALHNMLG